MCTHIHEALEPRPILTEPNLCSEASTVAAATAMMRCVCVSRVLRMFQQEMKSVVVVKNLKSELIWLVLNPHLVAHLLII